MAVGAAVGTRPLPSVALPAAFVGVILLLMGWGRRLGAPEVLLLGTLLGGAVSSLVGVPWHLGLLAGVAGAAMIVPGAFREQMRAWWRVLRLTPQGVVLLVASTAAAGLFVTWEIAARDGFFFPLVTSQTVLTLAAMVNAAAEELVWRGAAVALLLSRGATVTLTMLVSSISFGVAHLTSGVPEGLLALPTAGAYGIAMCLLARIGRSLWLPLISHVVVDLAVVAALAGWPS